MLKSYCLYCILIITALFPINLLKAAKVSSISQYGITWYFEKPVEVGQYVNGDWWVVGPVKVIRVTPVPGSVSVDSTKITLNHWNDTSLSKDTTMRNGSMIVLKPNEYHGYDSRNQLFRQSECVTFPLVLSPNQSLISTESNTNLPVANFCKEYTSSKEQTVKTVLKSAAVLTCVSKIPPKDAFRPPYAGDLKPVFLARNIDWSKLPKLKPVGSVPSWPLFEHYFQRPWIDHILSWQQQEIVPNENEPNYGREQARLVSIASLMLMLDVPQKQKEKLTIELIQRGIDLYGLALAGTYWNEGGGHSSGRKWPILFASIMLKNPTIAQLPESALFQEDTQTYYGKGWFGQTVLWQMIQHHGIRDTYEEKNPATWGKWDSVSESYRLNTTGSAWIGTALVARYMNAVQLWGHDAFFDYTDRWMQPDNPNLKAKENYVRPIQEGKAFDLFVTEMWKAYRANAPAQPKSGHNLKWIWQGKIGVMVPNKLPE